METRVSLATDELYPGGSIVVDHGRDTIAPSGSRWTGNQHVFVTREVRPHFEPFVRTFGKDAGRKRPKVLAVLDPAIENSPHIGSARIRKQRPIAKRTRSELHAALKPADDLAIGDHVGGFAGGVLASPRRETGRLEGSQYLAFVELRAEISGSRL